ncbi:hypothetical protein ACLB1E_27110 [Escherichia coli]
MRHITYYLDRPDVLARFTTKILADKIKYPFLLSNGNRVAQGELENRRIGYSGRTRSPKPCYLFALVAGSLMYCAIPYHAFWSRSSTDI